MPVSRKTTRLIGVFFRSVQRSESFGYNIYCCYLLVFIYCDVYIYLYTQMFLCCAWALYYTFCLIYVFIYIYIIETNEIFFFHVFFLYKFIGQSLREIFSIIHIHDFIWSCPKEIYDIYNTVILYSESISDRDFTFWHNFYTSFQFVLSKFGIDIFDGLKTMHFSSTMRFLTVFSS